MSTSFLASLFLDHKTVNDRARRSKPAKPVYITIRALIQKEGSDRKDLINTWDFETLDLTNAQTIIIRSKTFLQSDNHILDFVLLLFDNRHNLI